MEQVIRGLHGSAKLQRLRLGYGEKGLKGEWEKLSEARARMDGEAGQTQSPFTGRRAINNGIGHAFRGTLSGTLVGWRKHV